MPLDTLNPEIATRRDRAADAFFEMEEGILRLHAKILAMRALDATLLVVDEEKVENAKGWIMNDVWEEIEKLVAIQGRH